ncbi:sensor histidine kinase [Phycicoccus duodecadis]|uniref:histidine kinase n=1 Tax=Phycicoccus duodecadis TaxID=173053 RepID=A0A2N3YHA5_9MICO|nr:phospho-acceptor domain-containing protein [Phycicoccus duodecadis]
MSSPPAERALGNRLLIVWLTVLVLASVVMICRPRTETVAIEVVVMTFAVVYGFGMWPVLPTIASVTAFVVIAASTMIPRSADGDLPSNELVELAAPFALGFAVIYHARRREQAVRRLTLLAALDRRQAAARERLSRMTSHELRTPLTIASGYVDHLLTAETDEERREELLTVRDELEQISRLGERLVRAVALDLGAPEERPEARPLLEEVARRWRLVVDREIVVDCRAESIPVNIGRLKAALDTLVENSVRYTGDGGRIRLFAHEDERGVVVGVADSGPGLSPQLVDLVNAGVDRALDDEEGAAAESPQERLRDVYSQTGFGLRIVASVAQSAGGRLLAGTAPEGGAQLTIDLRRVRAAGGLDDDARTTSETVTEWETPPETPVTTTR